MEIFDRLHDRVYTINRVNLANDWSKMTDQAYSQADSDSSQMRDSQTASRSESKILVHGSPSQILQLSTVNSIFYQTIFNNGSCQKFYSASIENSNDRWVKLKLTSNDLILAQYEIKELIKFLLYVFLIKTIGVDFFKIFGFYFWSKLSFENFLGDCPIFRESIFRISIFQFSNDLILNLRIINFRSSKTFLIDRIPKIQNFENFYNFWRV